MKITKEIDEFTEVAKRRKRKRKVSSDNPPVEPAQANKRKFIKYIFI